MRLAEFVEPATVVSERASIRDVESTLAAGAPVYVRLASGWHALLPRSAVAYPSTRLVIDAPLTRVAVWPPELPVQEIFRRDALAEWCLVGTDDLVIGHVSRRRIVSELASAALGDPRSAGAVLTARAAAAFVHDLANALTGVEMTLAVAEADASEVAEDFELAQTAVRHAVGLARQLRALCLGLPTSNGFPLSVNDVVTGFLDLRRLMTPPDVEVRLALGDDVPEVRAHRWMIERMLLNLATNAADAMDGRGTVTIGTSAHASAGRRYAVVRVSDTGPGIAPELGDRVFEVGLTSRPGRGTGIGRAAVARTVAQLGGRIELEASDAGACFRITLPASE